MKVFEAVAQATQLLDHAVAGNPRLDAERLLAFEFGVDRTYLLGHFHDTVDDPRLERFFAKVQARSEGMPLQYLLGSQEFRGLDFAVTQDVLIPRPETELVVEEALRRVSSGNPWIVDVGTGSGCIAVSVAVALPGARVWAVDLSAAALDVAARNAARHGVAERIHFLQGDLLSPLRDQNTEGTIDCVLSNPPYVAENELPALQQEVRDWEPRMALVGGPSGLGVCSRLVPEAHRCLRPGGHLIMEIGYSMRDAVVGLFDLTWRLETVCEDYNGIPRVVVASKR
jgi:release factor glutamine methyltransferase